MSAMALVAALSLASVWVVHCQDYTPWEKNVMVALLSTIFLLYLFWHFLQVAP